MTPWLRFLAVLALVTLVAAPAWAQGFFDRLGKSIDKGLGMESGDGAKAGGGESGSGASGGGAHENRLAALKAKGEAGACGGDGRQSLLSARVEQGLGVIESKPLESYLNGVLGKLVAASSGPQCQVRIYTTPHDSVQAVALADGGILVGIGFLRNLKSEDEVACLFGHELSHILLKHHSSDSFLDTQDELLKGLDTANNVGAMLAGSPGLSGKLQTVSDVGGAVYGVSEGLIAPAWTRDQEDQADLLGADLCAGAGYNPRAMASVLDVIAAHEAANAAVDAERKRLQEERFKNTVLQSAVSTNTSDTWSIIGSVAKVTSAAVASIGAEQRQHRTAAERKESVVEYVRQHHGAARRVAFTAGPWEQVLASGATGAVFERYREASEARRIAYTGGDIKAAEALAKRGVVGEFSGHAYPRLAFAEVRQRQGNREAAAQNLQLAMREPNVPWQIFRGQADLQLAGGDTRGAAATVERADELYGRPLAIAPYAIKVHRMAGDARKVNEYLDRCERSGKRAQMEVCLAAAGLTKQQYDQQRLRRGG